METEEKNIINAMHNLFLALANGKRKCEIEIPCVGNVKAEIIAIDLINIEWKPVKVKFFDKLKIEETCLEDNFLTEGQHLTKKWCDYKEDWISVLSIKNYE